MKIKRYFAPDTRHAMRQIRAEQGPDAVILCCRAVAGGTEVVTAAEPEAPPRPRPLAQAKPVATVPPPDPAAANPLAEMHAIRRELHSMRGLLDDRFTRLAEIDFRRRHPLASALTDKLRKFGFAPSLLRPLTHQLPFDQPQQAWHELLVRVAGRIRTTHDDILSQGGQIALLGPSGSGKTSTIAKLAARFILRHGRHTVTLIASDHKRIGGVQQLQRYAQLMQAPMTSARNAKTLAEQLTQGPAHALRLVDTAGLGPCHPALEAQLKLLAAIPRLRRYLVAPATMSTAVFERLLRSYRPAALSGVILTHVDESIRLGTVLSSLIQQQLPVAYIADGVRIPEDLAPARAGKLLGLAIATSATAQSPSADRRPTEARRHA